MILYFLQACMAVGKTYTVSPSGKMWKVESNGRRVSKHRKKRKAVEKAKQLADRNDSITIQKANGQFQKRL